VSVIPEGKGNEKPKRPLFLPEGNQKNLSTEEKPWFSLILEVQFEKDWMEVSGGGRERHYVPEDGGDEDHNR